MQQILNKVNHKTRNSRKFSSNIPKYANKTASDSFVAGHFPAKGALDNNDKNSFYLSWKDTIKWLEVSKIGLLNIL
jgi:hypothetical protein